jgi:antirestriction protein
MINEDIKLSDDDAEFLGFHLGDDYAEIWAAFCECFGPGNSPRDCVDAYAGQYDSEEDYAHQYVDDTGMLSGAPKTVAMYFDYDAFARDLFINDLAYGDKGHVFYTQW